MTSRLVEIRFGRAQRAYTLVELSIALSIVGILASVTGSRYLIYLDRARTARAIVELRAFAAQIDPAGDDDAAWPATLAEAGITTPDDPWGNPYQYLLIDGNLPRGLAAEEPLLPSVAAPPAGKGGGAGNAANAGGPGGEAGGNSKGNGAAGKDHPGGGGSGGGSIMSRVRKDRFLAPINTDFDLYSLGPDGESRSQLNAKVSRDDIVRAANGSFYGVAEDF